MTTSSTSTSRQNSTPPSRARPADRRPAAAGRARRCARPSRPSTRTVPPWREQTPYVVVRSVHAAEPHDAVDQAGHRDGDEAPAGDDGVPATAADRSVPSRRDQQRERGERADPHRCPTRCTTIDDVASSWPGAPAACPAGLLAQRDEHERPVQAAPVGRDDERQGGDDGGDGRDQQQGPAEVDLGDEDPELLPEVVRGDPLPRDVRVREHQVRDRQDGPRAGGDPRRRGGCAGRRSRRPSRAGRAVRGRAGRRT